MRLSLLLLAALAVAGAGCDSVADEPPTESVPGVVFLDVRGDARVTIDGVRVADIDGAPPVSAAPPVVRAGVPFEVTVATHTGPEPCEVPGPSDVAVDGRTASVSVYESVRPDLTCFLVGTLAPRTDRVTFPSPGPAEVVVRGVRSEVGVSGRAPHELRFAVEVVE